jgi:hypothetical protein
MDFKNSAKAEFFLLYGRGSALTEMRKIGIIKIQIFLGDYMKKILGFLLCFVMILCFALPAFAVESVQSWLDNAREEEQDRIEYWENRYAEKNGEYEIKSYPMYHIADDDFYEKISLFNGIDKFISEKYDIITFALSNENPEDFNCNISWTTGTDSLITSGVIAEKIVDPEEFMLFIENIDSDISAGKFGKVKNVSLLLADFVNFKLNGEGDTTSLIITFAYIESEKGEFLVPYTVIQTYGEPILENGKIYTLKECTKIMKSEISVGKMSTRVETTKVLYPWQIALIAVAGVAALAGLFFGGKALIVYNQTRRRGGYHHF